MVPPIQTLNLRLKASYHRNRGGGRKIPEFIYICGEDAARPRGTVALGRFPTDVTWMRGTLLDVCAPTQAQGMAPTPPKVGIEPRGAALAVTTGACLAAGYGLLADFDDRRLKRSVVGGALGFLGAYLFIRGSRFDDAQTTAVVATLVSLASIAAYSRVRRSFYG